MLLSVTSAHESKSRSAATEKQTSRDYLAKDITLAVKQVEQALEFMFL